MDDKEKVLHQRQMLNKRLGLDMAGNLKLGIDTDIFSDEDLLTGIKQSQQLGRVVDAVSQTEKENLLHDKTNKMIYAPSKDSDQSGHPPSLIRVFTVHMK